MFARHPLSLALSFALLAGAACAPALSADTAEARTEGQATPQQLDAVVVTGKLDAFGASKSATPILETARSIAVETEAQFRDKGALTLDDTLNYTAGVVGDTFGFSTRGDFPRVRGFNAAEYRDGQQVLFGFYNNTRSDVYLLEQVEVLKGPASVLYGKGTPGGIVNAISKVAGPDAVNELVLDAGSHDRYQIATDFSAPLGENLWLRTVAVARDAGTQIDFVNDDALIAMPSISYDNGDTRISALYEYSDRDSDTAHQFLPLTGTGCISASVRIEPRTPCVNADGRRIDTSTYHGEPGFNRYDTRSGLLSLLGSHAISEQLSVDGVLRYKDAEADYRQAWVDFRGVGRPRVNADGIGTRSFYWSDADSRQLAVDLRARYTFSTGAAEHELFVGLTQQDVVTGNRILFQGGLSPINVFDPVYGNLPDGVFDPANLTDLGDVDTEDRGIYLSDQISIDRWRINLGLRHDEIDARTASARQKDDATSFSAGLLYAFDGGLASYVSFAESFEPVIGTDGFTGNPLKPREGEQWELGVKYQPEGTRTYITAAYFEIRESNLPNPASLIGQPDSQQEGIGRVEGIEIEAQTTLGDWYLEGNASWLDTRNPNGKPFDSVPEQQASGWLQYQPSEGPLDGYRFGLGVRYQGENESNGVGADGPLRVVTDGAVLGDLLVGYSAERWDLSLNLRNLADKDYYATCLARGDCFPGERRTVMARMSWWF